MEDIIDLSWLREMLSRETIVPMRLPSEVWADNKPGAPAFERS
jgi:hypothetical protein